MACPERAQADPEVDVIPHPLPQARLVARIDPGDELSAPALHHLRLGRPELDTLPRDFLPPVLPHLGVRIDQPHGEVPRQVLERTAVDALVPRRTAGLDAGDTHVGNTSG